MNKIVIIGPSSVHVTNFIDVIAGLFKEVIYISSEDGLVHDGITRQYKIGFKSLNPIQISSSKSKLKSILLKEQPEVVHIHQVTRHAFFSVTEIKRLNIPCVLTAWGSDVLVMPNRNFLYKKLVKRALLGVDYVTGDSYEMISAVSNLGRKVKNEMILFAVDPIMPLKKEKIIYSNRLHEPIYNIETILQLYNSFVKKHPDWKLNIAGSGSLTQNLKDKVDSLGLSDKVQFLGWLEREENRTQYQKAQIYISIPESDGTAVSVLEAMSAGCIPILPNLKVTKEWITKDNGIIYQKESSSNPLEEALNLDFEKISKYNSELIIKKGSLQVAREQYLKIYKSIVK